MTFENLRRDLQGGVLTLTIDRPKALNALDRRTLEELEAAIDEAGADPGVRALILTGGGEKAFVAGGDIAAMSVLGPVEALRFAELGHRVMEKLERLPIPTIAAVNGFALGGGCELAMGCDLVYASEAARFGQPEVNLGLIPGFGGTQRLSRRVGVPRALELVLTGDLYDAARAKAIGLVLEVLPAAELLPHCRAVAGRIASRAPLAVAAAKRAVHAGADAELSTANELERQAFSALFGTADAREGMRAFLEKRPARFTNG